ncbi:MAG: hypothetical protein AABX77_01725 [Nanoarchaeota archaeon]
MPPENISEICVNALKQAYYIQKKLLEEKIIAELVSVGRGEDRATKGDWESEEVVISYLKKENFPGKIISEEHGQIDIIKNPGYLAILDGIDGSSGLVKNQETRCGTILTVSDSLKPTYDDFIFSGITEFVSDRIVYGLKGEGVWLIENVGKNEKITKLPNFQEKNKSFPEKIIKIDCYNVSYADGITKGMNQFEEFMAEKVVSKLEGKMKLTGSITHSEMCLDLLLGEIDAVAHVVAKGVFEPPNLYLMTKELGGWVSDLKGNDLRNREWKPVGMNIDGAIFASSREIGRKIISYLNR